jgi:pimeloyl-ACP methyl ester carboxylesterase
MRQLALAVLLRAETRSMRRMFLVLTALFALSSASGFALAPQVSGASVEILDRSGKVATRITDGDTIRLRVALPSVASSPQNYTFKLDETSATVGTCQLGSGSSCETDAFEALGWHWDAQGSARNERVVKAYDASGALVAQSARMAVLPRPVVMVHGFVSSADAWKDYLGPDGYLASMGLRGFAVGDGQVPGVMKTGTITDPTGTTNTIAQNAAILGQYMAEVKKATGAQMVDLVVHSMGGMIARYYIDRVMQDRDVAQLIMLGSPMGGSDCAVLPAALDFYLPASIEIRQSYMEGVFNRQITHRRGVEFYDLAGTAITKPFQSPCAAVPNDIAVSVESVNAVPLQSSQVSMLHTELTTSPEVFQSFIQPLLEKPAGTFADDPDPAPAGDAAPPLQFTRVYTGHVAPGGSSELAITIEPNVTVASFALYDLTRSVDVSVRGASGNVIQLNPQTNGFIRIDDPSSLVYLGYGFADPKPGVWRVTVLPSSTTPKTGADFSISVYFVGGAKLTAQSSTLIAKLGEAVQFDASLSLGGQPLQITKAQAIVRGPNGKSATLDLQPGMQATGSWTPRSSGTYGVDIIVTGRAPDGSQIERTAFLAEEVQPNPSKLQISANLIAVVVVVLGVIALLAFVAIRLVSRLVRRR